MTYEWAPPLYDALPPDVRAVRQLLQDWFDLIEHGQAESHVPSPFHDPPIDQATADTLVEVLDAEFGKELVNWASGTTVAGGPHTLGPGFQRLAPPQRLALAQELHAVLKEHKSSKQESGSS